MKYYKRKASWLTGGILIYRLKQGMLQYYQQGNWYKTGAMQELLRKELTQVSKEEAFLELL